MDYPQTIDFLYTQLPMFSRDGAAALKNDLSNTYALCAVLGNPQNKFKSIHIAGTNGKGSSSHMLAAILQAAGYKVGLYTSPHLYDFRERIRINGELCSKEFVVQFVEGIRPHLATIAPSFFEITVAMAFSCFAEERVDIAVIETGLGGRLDSTNIIDPEISLITNIGLDHMQFLGDTLELIAGEKAGIIKKGKPVVVAEYLPETRSVFEKVAALNQAPIYFASDEWQISISKNKSTDNGATALNPLLSIDACRANKQQSQNSVSSLSKHYLMDLTGNYQLYNLTGVLETVYQLQKSGWRIAETDVYNALQHVASSTGLSGRWEQVLSYPRLITDVGHNMDGIRMINAQLKETKYRKLHIVTGFVKDKDVTAALKEMPGDARFYFTKAPIDRALDEQLLYDKAKLLGLRGLPYPNMEAALRAAGEVYEKGDLILVCGSVFLVAEVKGALAKEPFKLSRY
ncbi:MAG TPA: folylpolyglutamate synthase/dihydrofolate synthase family protein [Arachidicoccus sp.]|nr:folylpolyglutamate synthase/dihydrofolate synthase family protein [Arachidicoccus sp.]